MPTDLGGPRDIIDDYSDTIATFGDRLGLARESMGLSQADLAERIGVKSQTVRNWEEDRAEPRANKLQMLAGLLNAPMIWLMSGQGDAPAFGDRPTAAGRDRVAQACVAELRRLRFEQARLIERMTRLEKRLRAVLEARG